MWLAVGRQTLGTHRAVWTFLGWRCEIAYQSVECRQKRPGVQYQPV